MPLGRLIVVTIIVIGRRVAACRAGRRASCRKVPRAAPTPSVSDCTPCFEDTRASTNSRSKSNWPCVVPSRSSGEYRLERDTQTRRLPYTCPYARTHARACAHTHARKNASTHALMHAHTHSHAHICRRPRTHTIAHATFHISFAAPILSASYCGKVTWARTSTSSSPAPSSSTSMTSATARRSPGRRLCCLKETHLGQVDSFYITRVP